MGKNEVKFKAIMKREELVQHLEDFVSSLKQGVICVSKGEEYAMLSPTEKVEVEIEASGKKDKYKFEMELTWEADPFIPEAYPNLKISATVPQPKPVDIEDPMDEETNDD